MRIVLVALSVLLVTDCTGQVGLAKYGSAESKQKAVNLTTSRSMSVKDVDYDGVIPLRVTRDVPTVDIGKSSVGDIGLAREKDDSNERVVRDSEKGSGTHQVRAAMTAGQATAPLSFVEKSAKNDKENQILGQKTVICSSC
jgi:hypothetical protein